MAQPPKPPPPRPHLPSAPRRSPSAPGGYAKAPPPRQKMQSQPALAPMPLPGAPLEDAREGYPSVGGHSMADDAPATSWDGAHQGYPAPPGPRRQLESNPAHTSSPAPGSQPGSQPGREAHPSQPGREGSGAGYRPLDPTLPEAELRHRCETELSTSPSPQRRARLHYELSRIAPDPEAALEALDAALDAQPEFLPALRLAREMRFSRGDVAAGLAHIDVELRLEPRPAARALLLRRKGRALEDLAQRPEEARTCYAEATRLDPDAVGPLRALEQVEHAAEAWRALDETRLRSANATRADARHRAALLVERARLLENRLGETDTAVELYGEALRLDPMASRAAQSLKRLLHQRARWRDLISVLEREASTTRDPKVRAQAYFRIGRIYGERLGDDARAADALSRAMNEAPTDRLIQTSLERLYHETSDHHRLAHVLAHAVENIARPHERVGLMHRIGQLFEKQLGDVEQAKPWYDAALQLSPAYAPALVALDRLLAAAQAWESVIVMHLGAAEATDDSARRATAHSRIAEVFEHHLSQPEEAMRHHRQALSLDPSIEGSFKALLRLYRVHGRHRERIELLERSVARTEQAEQRFACLMQIGAIYEDNLGEADEAIGAYRRILKERHDHLEALHAWQRAADRAGRHRELIEALEREAELTDDSRRRIGLLQRSGEVLASIDVRDEAVARFREVLALDELYAPALSELGKLFHYMGRPADQRDVLERELRIAKPGRPQVELLHKLGMLTQLELGDDDAAIAYFRRAIAVDPRYGPSLRAVALLLRKRRDFEQLVEVLQSEREGAETDDEAAACAYRLGEVYEIHLDRDPEALAAYVDAVEHAPSHRPALDGCFRVRARLEQWRDQAQALEADARRVEDFRLAIDALLRAGELYDARLGTPTEAIAAFEAVRSIDPNNLSALLALEPLYRAAGLREKLAEVYLTQSRVSADLGQRVAALEELARLHADDPIALLQTCSQILELHGTQPEALRLLEPLARTTGDRALMADVHGRLARVEVDPALIAIHYTTVGECHESVDPRSALGAFHAALEQDGENIAAIRGLARTAERTGDFRRLVDACQREAAWTHDGELAADALVRSAEVRLEQLGESDGAIDDAERALERWPDHEGAARQLSELLRERGAIDQLIVRMSRAAGAAVTLPRRSALWRVVARLYANDKQDLSAAFAALDRLMSEADIEGATYALLGDLRRRNRQLDEACEAYRNALEVETTSKELQARMHWALAQIESDKHKKKPNPEARHEALSHLQSMLILQPSHRDGWLLQLELHREAGDEDAARVDVQNLLPLTSSVDERAWLHRILGGIEDRTGRRKEACLALWEAVAIEGPAGDAAAHYKRLLDEDEPWHRYIAAVEEHLRRVGAGEVPARGELRDVYIALARIHHEVLLEHDQAIAALRRGLDALDGDPALRHELADRLRNMGRYEPSVDAYRILVDRDPADMAAWRGMARSFHESQRKLESGLAFAPLVLVGDASDLEQGMARQRRVAPGHANPGSLGPTALDQVAGLEPGKDPRLIKLLEATMEALPKLQPHSFDQFGLTARDRLPDDHPLARPLGPLCAALGLSDGVDVYLQPRARTMDVLTLARDRPALVVPQPLAERTEAERVFALARSLVPWAHGTAAIPLLGPQRAIVMMAAALGLAAPGWGRTRIPTEELEQVSKLLVKGLSRRQRKLVEQTLAPACLQGPAPDLDRFVPTVPRVATRVAALVTNDLPATANWLVQNGEAKGEPMRVLRGPGPVCEIARFWVSPLAMDLRRRAGIL